MRPDSAGATLGPLGVLGSASVFPINFLLFATRNSYRSRRDFTAVVASGGGA